MIDVGRRGDIVTLTLARPDAGNAFSLDRWSDLAAAVATVASDAPSVVILRSAHPTIFSAGADLGEMQARLGESGFGSALRSAMGAAIEALAALPMPTIAAIDGSCYGAAVALTLACDLRIAGDRARFAVTPAKLGISYPARDIARLLAAVGRGQAAWLLFTAEAIDADDAHRIHLADIRAPEAQVEAERVAAVIATNSATAAAALKAALSTPDDATFDALFAGDDFAARVTSIRRNTKA